MIYTVEKYTTVEYIVMASKEGGRMKEPVAKCNSESDAKKIKHLYEEDAKEHDLSWDN